MATSCAVNDKSAVVAEALSKLSNDSISVSIASKLIARAVKDGLLKQEDVREDNISAVARELYDMTAKRVREDYSLTINKGALADAEKGESPRGWSPSLSYGNAYIGKAGDPDFLLSHGYADVTAVLIYLEAVLIKHRLHLERESPGVAHRRLYDAPHPVKRLRHVMLLSRKHSPPGAQHGKGALG